MELSNDHAFLREFATEDRDPGFGGGPGISHQVRLKSMSVRGKWSSGAIPIPAREGHRSLRHRGWVQQMLPWPLPWVSLVQGP